MGARMGLHCLFRFMRGVLASLLVFSPLIALAAPPLDAYGQLPNVENIVLSPNGELIAFVRTDGDTRAIAVVTLADGKFKTGLRGGKSKLRHISWAGNDHLLVQTSSTASVMGLMGPRREYFQLTVYNIETQKAVMLPKFMSNQNMMNIITGEPMVRRIGGQPFLFIPGIHITDRTLPALFRYNLATGRQDLFVEGNTVSQDWFIDEAGELAVRVDYSEKKRAWDVSVRRDGKLQSVWGGTSDTVIPYIQGFGPTAGTVLVNASDDEQPVWKVLGLAGKEVDASMDKLTVIEDTIVDPQTYYLIGSAHVKDDTQYEFLDAATQRKWKSVLKAFEGARVTLESHSAGFSKLVVRVDGGGHGLAYFLVDTKTWKADFIGRVYDAIEQTFETKRITYSAADGLEIPAYLTLPARQPQTKLPLIVLPHGGPAARDTADFDWWTQALAAQGYAVLRPNFRGSWVDWKFMSAGFGEWGRKMQTDLSDGVRYLTKEGIIDPARVCIVGASYGGYAALAGVTLDPGVYRCAVSVAGLSDLPAFLSWVDAKYGIGPKVTQRYWDRFMGVASSRDPVLKTISPAQHVDKIDVPVLLIHGKDDTVVPFHQSEIMLKAMKRAQKNVQLISLKQEDHWLSRGATRLQMLQESVAFLRTHNPPD
jgi:dipeptidyl aminopeptidase/acylaminoacyl peptidase